MINIRTSGWLERSDGYSYLYFIRSKYFLWPYGIKESAVNILCVSRTKKVVSEIFRLSLELSKLAINTKVNESRTRYCYDN